MIVKTTGKQTFKVKDKIHVKEGPIYLHFLEPCLKNYFQHFQYDMITVPSDTSDGLTEQAKNYIKSLGLKSVELFNV